MLKDKNIGDYKTRIYWEDTDAGGRVFHANYLKFADRARTEYLNIVGLKQSVLQNKYNIIFMVSQCNIKYQSPARLDDKITVSSCINKVENTSFTMEQRTVIDKTIVNSIKIKLTCMEFSNNHPVEIPNEIIKKLNSLLH